MKYEYVSVTGKIIIEIDAAWRNILVELDHLMYSINRRETRRHISLEVTDMEAAIRLRSATVEDEILRSEGYESLRKALTCLFPDQQELVEKVFMKDQSIASVAASEGVSEAAIRNRLKKIYTQMRKILKEGVRF